jgi:hypothetical protein
MSSPSNPMPDPQNPDDPMYQFIDEQPEDEYPQSEDTSLSHYTYRQFTPEDITATFPVVVTITDHGLTNGQALRATKFITMPFASATGMEQLNSRSFIVQQAAADTFELYDYNGLPVDGSTYTPYIQGGEFTLIGPTLPIVNPSNFPPSGVPNPFA